LKAAVLAAALLVCGSAGAAPTQISLHVWVVRLDGTGRADLTAAEELATSPSVAPDGTISYVNGDGHVWLMNADGTDKRPLGSVPGPGELELASAPTWSPGGGDVAYTLVRLVPGAECASWSIVVRDAGTGEVVSTLADALGPSWAPTAPRIALESNTAHCKQPGSLAVATLDGARHRLAVRPHATGPSWSPGGQRLAFYCWSAHAGLCVVNADGRKLRTLATNAPNDLDAPPPTWSPDGKKVAFTTKSGRARIVTLSTRRGRSLGRGTAPSWSPNGRWLAAFSGDALEVWSAETGKGRIVTHVEGGFRLVPPAWSPDGRLLYFTST